LNIKIFKFLIINFLFINSFNAVASETQFEQDLSKFEKVNPLCTYKTLDELSQYISNVLIQLSKQPVLDTKSASGACHVLRMDDTITNITIISVLINNYQNYVHTHIRYGREWILFLFMNKECDLEIVIECFKKIIEELKHGWKKISNSTDKTYTIEKSPPQKNSETFFKTFLVFLIEKFNLQGVKTVRNANTFRILIPEDVLEKAFLAFDFNISYSVEDAEKIEKLKKLLNLIIQNPDKTKSLLPVLSEIVLSYFLTPVYLFKFSQKEIDDFIGSQTIILNW